MIYEEQQQYVVVDRELVRGLSEKEVEIEHLRTQVVALSEKAGVVDDMRLDVQAVKDLLRGSEASRADLQRAFTETSRQVREDTANHQDYQGRLIAENERLKQELAEARALAGRKEQEHLGRIDDLCRSNQLRAEATAQAHFDAMTVANNAHVRRLEELQAEHKAKLDELTKESNDKIEALTKDKDFRLATQFAET